MDYSLALELKNAGFPQYGDNREVDGTLVRISPQYGDIYGEDLYIPTLEELIEACGENLRMLNRVGDHWEAVGMYSKGEYVGKGSTPLEAVARLWLAINKK